MKNSFNIIALALLVGCAGDGSVDASIWGEDYIEQGIPAASAAEPAGFENGWSLRYTKFLVNVGALTLAASDGTPGASLPAVRVYDLHTLRGPLSLGTLSGLSPVRYDSVGYRMEPAGDATTAGNATAADVTLMRSGRYSVYVEGEGQRMGVTVRFRWGFGGAVAFERCHSSETEVGVAVPSGGVARAQVTVHGDHLFYDDLQSPDAKLRFDLIASADGNRDGEVTLDELAAVDLTTAPRGQYGVGSRGDVLNLRQFVTALVATVGHFNGEGHCDERRM